MYYIGIDKDNRLIAKFTANHEREGVVLSKEDWDLLPTDLYHDNGKLKYDYIDGKATERTDKEYIDAVKKHEDDEKILEEKIKHDEAVWTKAYEIAEKELGKGNV